jgi:hypothetical protein
VAVELVGHGAKSEVHNDVFEKEETKAEDPQTRLLRAKADWFFARANKLRVKSEVLDAMQDLYRARIEEQEHRTSIAELELKQKQLEFEKLRDLRIDELKSEIERNVAKNKDQSTRIGDRTERNRGQPRSSSPPRSPPQNRPPRVDRFNNPVKGVAALEAIQKELSVEVPKTDKSEP